MNISILLEAYAANGERKLSPHEVVSEIAKHRRVFVEAEGNECMTPEMEAELLAFDLQTTRKGDTSAWGTYYRPVFVPENADGELECQPNKSKITENVVNYWELRATQSSHPYLRFRYASLSWDLRGKVLKSKNNIAMARLLIESSVDVAAEKLYSYRHEAIEHLLYAMQVAIATKNESGLAQIRSTLIDVETEFAEDEMLGTWGFCFDNLLPNKSAQITDEEKHTLLSQLEERLDRIIGSDATKSPFGIEACVARLASHYRRIRADEKLAILLRRYTAKIAKVAQETGGIFGVTWLQQAHSFLVDQGASGLANSLNSAIREAGIKANESMITTTHKTTITDDEIRDFLAPITNGTLEYSILWIAANFVSNKDDAEASVRKSYQNSPLAFLFGTTKMDHQGRPVANVGRPEADMEGNVVLKIADDLRFASYFLRRSIEQMREVHLDELELLSKFMLESASFTDDSKLIVAKALEQYFAGEYLVFIHLAVPQIEAAFRNLVGKFGGATLKRGRYGSLMQRNLDELLREPSIEELFHPRGESVVQYLKILLTDQRGWNLRNNVSHGLGIQGGMSFMAADRLFHVLLLLALVREPSCESDLQESADQVGEVDGVAG